VTRDESLQIVEMVLSHWRIKNWEKDEIDVFARMIQDLDAEIATSTVIRASKDLVHAPRIAEFRELYRAEKKRLAPELSPASEPAGQPLPLWVKRWICARQLYSNFGKERDMRRFPEQGDYGDLTQETMPEGAWEEQAKSLGDADIHKAFKQMFRS